MTVKQLSQPVLQEVTQEKPPRICVALRKARVAQGLSQEALAKRMGLAQSHVSRWESYREPSLDTVELLEIALGVEQGFLLVSAGYLSPESFPPATKGVLYDPRFTEEYRELVLKFVQKVAKRSQAELTERLERLANGQGAKRPGVSD